MSDFSFEWDRDNRSFVSRPRCPNVACGLPTEPMHEDGVLGRCEACGRTYESVLMASAEGGPPVEWNLRADSAFNTFTGQPFTRYSPQDWSEAGGEPGRSSCVDDPRGRLFGVPDPAMAVHLRDGWATRTIAPEEAEESDHVVAVAVMRGRVVALTRRGRLGILDAGDGTLRTPRPIDWPSHPPPGRVAFAPAVRGTLLVAAAPNQALFRDLLPQLFATGDGRSRGPVALAEPTLSEAEFVGPPLGVDGARPCFALLEARTPRGGGLADPHLRFYEADGSLRASVAVPGIARPPVYDRQTNRVLWIDESGFLGVLDADRLEAPRLLPSEQILALRPSLHGTFCVAPSAADEPEVWVANVHRDGELEVSKANLRDALDRGELRWTRKRLGSRGELVGLAVGRGPGGATNAASQLLAVATDQGVFSYPKDLSDRMEHVAARGHESADRRGSWDSPLLTSAGTIARVPGSIQLLGQGIGWGPRRPEFAPLPVRYDRAQGLALLGRKLFFGVAMGVRCVTLEPRPMR